MLSFLMPAYECSDVVTEAVESALAQSIDQKFEVVAVDDCSSDATYEVLTRLAGRHRQLRVYRHSENRGGGPARNSAAAEAQGDLLYVLDADNVLPEGCVQPQIDELRRRNAAAVSVGTVQFFDGATGDHRHRWQMVCEDGWSTLRHAFEAVAVPGAHGNYLYTRELFDAIGGYEPDLGAIDTWSFGFKHLANGFNVAIAKGVQYLHRVNRASYWGAEELAGGNDRNAITAVRRQQSRLPSDLRAKVDVMRPDDPFFAAMSAGGFRSSLGVDEFARLLEQIRRDRGRRPSPAKRLRVRVGQLLGR